MDTQTMDAFNRLLETIQNVGIGALAVTIIGMMVVAFILDQRNRARQTITSSEQFEKVMTMFANALNNQDSETAKAITPLSEMIAMNRVSLDQNTLAFQQSRAYREETLVVSKELTALQKEANAEFKALRIDIKSWPEATQSSIEILAKKVETLAKQVQLIDERIDNVKITVENHPANLQKIAAEVAGLSAEIHQSTETIMDMLTILTKPALPPAPSDALISLKRTPQGHAVQAATDEIVKPKTEPESKPGGAAA